MKGKMPQPAIMELVDGRAGKCPHKSFGILLGLTLVVLPIIVDPGAWDSFRFPKTLWVRAIAISIVCVAGLCWISSFSREQFHLSWRALDSLGRSSLLVGIWLLVAALASPDPWGARWAVANAYAGLVLFFAARTYGRVNSAPGILQWMVVPVLLNLLALVSQRTGTWFVVLTEETWQRADPVDQRLLSAAGLMGNRNDLGMYFVLALATGLFLISRAKKRTGGITVAAAAVGLLLTTTITAIIAAGVLVLLWLLMSYRPVRGNAKQRLMGIAAATVLAIFLALIPAWPRLANYHSFVQSGQMDTATGGRLGVSSTALMMGAENPVTGVGPGRFEEEYLEFALKQRLSGQTTEPRVPLYFDMVHNDFLEIFAETGTIGLLTSLLFVGIYCSRLRPVGATAGSLLGLSQLAAMVICALLLFPLQIAGTYGILAITSGLALGDHEASTGHHR